MTGRQLVSVALIVTLVAIGAVRVHRVRERTVGPQLLWNSSEAYLVIGSTRVGWRVRIATMMLGVLAPWGLPVSDSDRTATVFRIGPDRADRYVVEHMELGLVGALNGRIGNGVWRWESDHVEPVAQGEGNVRNDREFSNIDGWSKRTLPLGNAPSEGWRVPFKIGGQPATMIIRGALSETTTIELERSSGARERLWSLDEEPRTVSTAEYEALFRR